MCEKRQKVSVGSGICYKNGDADLIKGTKNVARLKYDAVRQVIFARTLKVIYIEKSIIVALRSKTCPCSVLVLFKKL